VSPKFFSLHSYLSSPAQGVAVGKVLRKTLVGVGGAGVPADSAPFAGVGVGEGPDVWVTVTLWTGVDVAVGGAVGKGESVGVGEGSGVGLPGAAACAVAVGARVGVCVGVAVGVRGTGVGAISVSATFAGSTLTSVMPCGTVTSGSSWYVPEPSPVASTVALISLGFRLWNCARVRDSVRVRLVGDGMAVIPAATFSIDGVTDSCHDVSNVEICTVTLMVELWPG